MRRPFGASDTPAPTSVSRCACSYTRTSIRARASATAAAIPPIPPPTTTARSATPVPSRRPAPPRSTLAPRTQLPSFELTLFQKRIQGALFGSGNPFDTIPQLLELYRAGQLKLDELVTNRYSLDEVNQGYRDMLDGRNIRGLLIHER